MNSTEKPAKYAPGTRFFQAYLKPIIAERTRSSAEPFFTLAADHRAQSYYSHRRRKSMSPPDFLVASVRNEQDLAACLRETLKDDRCQALEALAEPLARLAGELRQLEEQDSEVSPFIYAMF